MVGQDVVIFLSDYSFVEGWKIKKNFMVIVMKGILLVQFVIFFVFINDKKCLLLVLNGKLEIVVILYMIKIKKEVIVISK